MVKTTAPCLLAGLLFLGAVCASCNVSPTLVPTFTAPEAPPDVPQSSGFDQREAYRKGAYHMSGSFNIESITGGSR